MVSIAILGLAVFVVLALLVMARHRDVANGVDRDFGSISDTWLNERRAHDREIDINR